MVTYGVRTQRSSPLRLKAHVDGPDVRSLPHWCAEQQNAGHPVAIDLFAGAGGLSLGLHDAGWAVAAAVDHDPWALETHRANVPGLALDIDLGDPAGRATLVGLFEGIKVDLVAGGPPCQPFSRAGRSKIRSLVDAGQRDAEDDRRELWRAFVEVALALKPRAILMENVPDMALGDDMLVVRTIVGMLEAEGYLAEARIVDAWKYGVPQHRKRLILLARNDGQAIVWPQGRANITTLTDSIGDLPRLGSNTGSRELAYAPRKPLTEFQKAMRRNATAGVIHDHMTRAVRDDDLEIFKLMDSKTLYSEIPQELRRYTADTFNDKYKRLEWEDLSRTITAHIAKDGYWYIHPEDHRTLTVREAARLQTFPDAFRFCGTRSAAFKQIGNAVPPMLAEGAARILLPVTELSDASSRPTRTDWPAARAALATVARSHQKSSLWWMVPGPRMTAPVALAAAVLGTSRAPMLRVADALRHLQGRAKLDVQSLRSAADTIGGRSAAALERLAPLARKQRAWLDPPSLAELVPLTPTESELYRMLLGYDVMLHSQGVHRVAARVAGTASAQVNRNTDGRVDLARLVGAGPEAALRMSALRVLAATTCGVELKGCPACPLQDWCATGKSPTTLVPSASAVA